MHPLVLVPGDPARAMAIATAQLVEPRMFNHRRGLWGYSGRTPEGTGVVVQSTGMGGPSAAIVCEELIALGAEVLVRVGTCAAIAAGPRAGDVLVTDRVVCDDGTSRALGAGAEAAPDAALTNALSASADERLGQSGHQRGKVASVDLFYDPETTNRYQRLAAAGACAIEMEAATVLTVAARHNVRAACLLGVSDELTGDARVRLGQDEYVALGDLLGEIAVRAFAAATS